MAGHEVLDERVDGLDAIALSWRAGELRVGFAPGAGLVGYSLSHRGEELLGQRGGLKAYREQGSTFGIPLLHPWANRLAASTYSVGGRSVDLSGGEAPVHLDANGLPIHGLVAGVPYWTETGRTGGNGTAAFSARLDYAAQPELMAGFPFPHELHVEAELEQGTLRIGTILLPTGDVAVPVAFGWHPYLRLPGVPRADWRVELPVRRGELLDPLGLPLGTTEPVEIEPGPLGERNFDDHYVELDRPTIFALEGGGRRIEVELGEGYTHAQVYAPPASDPDAYICFEPMTAAVNALASGEGLRSVPPGGSFRADFTIRVS
jgi:aldose 1-epimerase